MDRIALMVHTGSAVATAIAANADIMVSGDQHSLMLGA
jgi:predicted nucleic acid-binding protein